MEAEKAFFCSATNTNRYVAPRAVHAVTPGWATTAVKNQFTILMPSGPVPVSITFSPKIRLKIKPFAVIAVIGCFELRVVMAPHEVG